MMCLWAQPAWINPYAQNTLMWDAELETGVKAYFSFMISELMPLFA
jgi:hypothetical protein